MGNLGNVEERCWKCSERLTNHFQMNSAEMLKLKKPDPGDLSMCGACGAFSEYDGNLHLVKPSLDRMRQIINTPALMDMQERLVKRDGM